MAAAPQAERASVPDAPETGTLAGVPAKRGEAGEVAAPNRDVAELQNEIRRLSEREAASREALDTLKTMMQARAARPQVAYLGAGTTGAFSAPAPAASATLTPPEDPDSARERAKLQEHLRQVETQLASERQQRQELEAQLKRLREETAVAPYAATVSEELVAARRKLQGLEAALASAQHARDDLATKYEDLKTRRERNTNTQQDAATQAEIAALEQRQREALHGLEQELSASQAREHELRQAVADAENSEGDVSYALVTDLRTENAALKTKLQEVHDQNVKLNGKLKAAARVTDMLFKDRAPRDERY